MPKDFMCDRITADSPIRFLDFDASNMINLYRPKIPYILKTIMNDGKYLRPNGTKKTSWKKFCMIRKKYEYWILIKGHRDINYLNSFKQAFGVSVSSNNMPTIPIEFNGVVVHHLPIVGDEKIKTPHRWMNGAEMNGGGYRDLAPSIRDDYKDILEQQVEKTHPLKSIILRSGLHTNHKHNYELWSSNGYEDRILYRHIADKINNSHLTNANCFWWNIKYHKETNSDEKKRMKILMKKLIPDEDPDYCWRLRNDKKHEVLCHSRQLLHPNYLTEKKNIMDYLKARWFPEVDWTQDKKLQAFYKKHNKEKLLKIYWKDLFDIVF